MLAPQDIVTALFTFLSGFFLWKIKKQSETIESHERDIISLKNTSVTDGHVRRIVKEELEPLSKQLSELVASMRNVEMFMAQERGFRAGVAQHKSERKED